MCRAELLVFDLDGTLLDADHSVPESVRAQLAELREMGIETTLATGRPFASARKYVQQLDLTLPLIVFNGAAVVTAEGFPLSTRRLPRTAAIDILKILSTTSAMNSLYLEPADGCFLTDRAGSATDHIQEKDGVGYRVVRSLPEVVQAAEADPVKVFSIGDRSELEEVQQAVRKEYPDISCVFSEHDMLELLGPSVNKVTALGILCEELGLTREVVCAFGDNMNDFELLKQAGTAVAMASAPMALRDAADYVVKHVGLFLDDSSCGWRKND